MINFIYLIVNMFILSYSFFMGVAVSRRNFRLSRPLALAGLAILFSQCAITFFPEFEYALFGFNDYAYIRWWGLAGAFLTLGAGFDNMNPGVRNLLTLITIVISIIVAIYWDISVAENGYYFNEAGWQDGVCAQSTGYTSAPASCVTLLKHFGVAASEKEMAGYCLTDRRGTIPIYIARGLKLKLDHDVYKVIVARADWEELENIPLPFITGLYHPESATHTVTVLEKKQDEITFADPLKRKKTTVKKDEFIKDWDRLVIYAVKR